MTTWLSQLLFKEHEQRLAEAEKVYLGAVQQRSRCQTNLKSAKKRFLGNPLNLLYPFTAGALVYVSQIKNDPDGLQRIPFFNLLKIGTGLWVGLQRIRRAGEITLELEESGKQGDQSDESDTSAVA